MPAGRLIKCDRHKSAPDPECHGCLLRCVGCNKHLRLIHFDERGSGGTGGVGGRYTKCKTCTKGPLIKERFKVLLAAAVRRSIPNADPQKTWDDLVADGCMEPWRLHEFDWLLECKVGNGLHFEFAELPAGLGPTDTKAWLEKMLAPSNVCTRQS